MYMNMNMNMYMHMKEGAGQGRTEQSKAKHNQKNQHKGKQLLYSMYVCVYVHTVCTEFKCEEKDKDQMFSSLIFLPQSSSHLMYRTVHYHKYHNARMHL